MPHRWRDDIAIADAAFEAWADGPEALLAEAAEALLELMAGRPSEVRPRVRRDVSLEDEPDLLLARLLQAVIWHRDAEGLFLRVGALELARAGGTWTVRAQLRGEPIDPERHLPGTEVKAVTMHRLHVGQDPDGTWRATVVLDV